MADAKAVLASVAGDRAFADDFFTRYIDGHEIAVDGRLLAAAGLAVRPHAPQSGFVGELRLQDAPAGVRITAAVPVGSPAYGAGLDRDDVITAIRGMPTRRAEEVDAAIRATPPGSTVPVTYLRRGRGQPLMTTLRTVADPTLEVVPLEQAGGTLSDAERRFREAWLSSHAGNTF
jgi:predicted metalloprotease with PDZ domain